MSKQLVVIVDDKPEPEKVGGFPKRFAEHVRELLTSKPRTSEIRELSALSTSGTDPSRLPR